MIRGEIYLDLTIEPEADEWTRDRQVLATLERCPDGVRVVVDLGKRTFLTQDSIWWIHQHGERLDLTIKGVNVQAIADFVVCSRAGVTGVVA